MGGVGLMTYHRGHDVVPVEKSDDGDSIVRTGTTESGNDYIAYVSAYRNIRVTLEDGKFANDGTDNETVTISVVDGLEVARGTDRTNATILDYSGDVTVSIDGVTTTKTLSNGSVSFDLTTDKPAGSTITVTAESLADHPSESDSVDIEVVQA